MKIDRKLVFKVCVAIKGGDAGTVRALLCDGAPVNIPLGSHSAAFLPDHCASLLNYAVGCNAGAEVLKVLIDAGADVNAVDAFLEGPLHWAADRGDSAEVLQALIDAGANLRAANRLGITALMSAASRGKVEFCKLLIDAGADIEQLDVDNHTPLHHAASQGRLDVCRLLVQAGARSNFAPHDAPKTYLTPFQTALTEDREEIVRFFVLECDEDLGQRTLLGRNMVDLARTLKLAEMLPSMRIEKVVYDGMNGGAGLGESPAVRSNSAIGPL